MSQTPLSAEAMQVKRDPGRRCHHRGPQQQAAQPFFTSPKLFPNDFALRPPGSPLRSSSSIRSSFMRQCIMTLSTARAPVTAAQCLTPLQVATGLR